MPGITKKDLNEKLEYYENSLKLMRQYNEDLKSGKLKPDDDSTGLGRFGYTFGIVIYAAKIEVIKDLLKTV